MFNKILALLLPALLWIGCASTPPEANGKPGKDSLIDSLTSFFEYVQSDRFDRAMQCLDPVERVRFNAMGGAQSPILIRRLKSLRLSTVAHRPTVTLGPNGLVGIFDELPNLSEATGSTTTTPASDSVGNATAKPIVDSSGLP